MTLMVANWKMNPKTLKESKALLEATKKAVQKKRGLQVIIAPPSIFLADIARGRTSKNVAFAAQDIYFEKEGSFTGEVSAPQVKDAGAAYVIIGHAERRSFGETNDDVAKKTKAVLDEGMSAIVCIGEHERDHGGDYLHFVRSQLTEGLVHVTKKQLKNIVIAYEPVWAIGAVEAMSPTQMHEMAIYIRKVLNDMYGPEGMKVPVLYGGSVDEVEELAVLKEGDVDGLLVGRASTKSDVFTKLLANI